MCLESGSEKTVPIFFCASFWIHFLSTYCASRIPSLLGAEIQDLTDQISYSCYGLGEAPILWIPKHFHLLNGHITGKGCWF